MTAAVAALRSGSISAVVSDVIDLQTELTKPPCNLVTISSGRYTVFYSFVVSSEYCIPGLTCGVVDFTTIINDAIGGAIDDGSIARLYANYFAAPSACSAGGVVASAQQVAAIDFAGASTRHATMPTRTLSPSSQPSNPPAGAAYVFIALLGLAAITLLVERWTWTNRALSPFTVWLTRWFGFFGEIPGAPGAAPATKSVAAATPVAVAAAGTSNPLGPLTPGVGAGAGAGSSSNVQMAPIAGGAPRVA